MDVSWRWHRPSLAPPRSTSRDPAPVRVADGDARSSRRARRGRARGTVAPVPELGTPKPLLEPLDVANRRGFGYRSELCSYGQLRFADSALSLGVALDLTF